MEKKTNEACLTHTAHTGQGEEELNERLFTDLHPNTELGIDLKLLTRTPGRMRKYERKAGALIRDGDMHYIFVEEEVACG